MQKNKCIFSGLCIAASLLVALNLPAEELTEWISPSGLKINILKQGTGEKATKGRLVSVHYTGWLTNGKKFDSSLDRKQPFHFRLGARQVIAGWDEGIEGMKVGEKRKLTVPPELAYGRQGAGAVIPPNATLIFDVELLNVQ